MTTTHHLGLPFIEGSQAQKHVTHNEALRILDAIVQIGVRDADRATPPSSPAEGDRHIVASGATGAWAGQAKAIALYEDGGWRFLAPKAGWCAWSAADGALLVYDGAAWNAAAGGGGGTGESVARLGVNDTATAPNLLTVRSSAALFHAIAAADGGSGDMRVQISKEAAGNTASVVFSDGFSGRAEFGLVGSDAFKLKVSADGTAFTEAFTIDPATGNLTLPRGLALSGVISPATLTADQDDYDPAGLSACAVLQLSADAPRAVSGLAGGAEGRVLVALNVGSAAITLRDGSPSSVAANRFAFGGDIVLGAKQAAMLRYDGTAGRWFVIARNGGADSGGGGGGGDSLSDADRRNIALDRIHQSKALGTARRGINTWTTGFKGASDAANGINTAASSNYLVNPADGYAAPTAAAGSRIASGITPTAPHGGTAANANDNNTGTTLTTSAWSSTAGITDPNSRIVVKFDLGADTSIAKLEAIGASISQYTGFIQFYYSTAAQGGGSNAWTKYGSDMPVSTTPADFSTTSAIMARYVAIMISQDTYNGSQTIGVQDFNVYAAAHNDMTLVTAAQTTDSSVGNVRALLEYDNAASPALNTDLTVEVTCDGGANWTSAMLSAVTAYSQGGRKVVETADTACTAGASFAARIKTFNSKNVMVYGAAVTVH